MIRLAFAVLLTVMLAVPPAAATALADRREQLQQLLSQLSVRRQRLRQVRQQERRVLGELEGIDRTRETAERRLADLNAEMRRSEAHAQATATKLAVAERKLAVQRERLRGRARDIYRYGRTGYLEVLLGAGDFAEFVTRWQLLSTIVRADSDLIAEYDGDVQEYQQVQTALRREQAYITTVTARTVARRREIEAQEERKRAVLARLQAERAAYERVVKELEEDSHELEVLINRMQAASGPRVGMLRGLRSFIWPARGVFTSGFGLRRHPLFGITRLHTGIDIAAARGTPVAAAADGRVIYTGWFGGYGKIVVLDHGGGISTLYAHLFEILTSEGALVHRGQIIGKAGSTGYSTGPHVHFEIRVNGRPIDPMRR